MNFAVPVLGTIVTVYRGWTSADVKHRGKSYRFINAHVESFYEPVQLAQIAELIQRTSNSEMPIVLAGDFNSDAEANGVAYNMLRTAGFADVWDLMPQSEPGYTWALSEEIPNVIAIPTQRLDLILTRGMIEHTSVDILGENLATDLTPSGFRPSDHAAVKASFVLQP